MSTSRILLIPGAPHTLLNLPTARDETAAFLRQQLQPQISQKDRQIVRHIS